MAAFRARLTAARKTHGRRHPSVHGVCRLLGETEAESEAGAMGKECRQEARLLRWRPRGLSSDGDVLPDPEEEGPWQEEECVWSWGGSRKWASREVKGGWSRGLGAERGRPGPVRAAGVGALCGGYRCPFVWWFER